jgi:hypothetical protein
MANHRPSGLFTFHFASYQSPTGFADPLRMKRVALIV